MSEKKNLNNLEKEIDKIESNIVVYTDGSTGPTNPGYCGSGITGYLYKTEDIKGRTSDRPTKTNITTHGYIPAEQQQKDNYESIKPSLYFNGSVSYVDSRSNNYAEAMCIADFIRILCDSLTDVNSNKSPYDKIEFNLEEYKVNKVVVNCDNTYAIGLTERIYNARVDWRKHINNNVDVWEAMEISINRLKELNIELEVRKVKGHSGDIGNDISDRLAYMGRMRTMKYKFRDDVIVFGTTPAAKYWKPKYDKHPFLLTKQLFIINNKRDKLNNVYRYSVMEYKTDVEPGRKTHEAMFGRVVLNSRDSYIEDTIDTYHEMMQTLSIISYIDISVLSKQKFITNYNTFGKDIFNYVPNRHTLKLLDEDTVVTNVYPTGLANQALEKILDLEQIMLDYTTFKTTNTSSRTFYEITDKLFKLDEKGKLGCTVKQTDKHMLLEFDGIKYPIEFGKDILARNTLARLVKSSPRVYLVSEQLVPSAIEYYTLIELEETKDIGVWCNFYSNKIFLNNKK